MEIEIYSDVVCPWCYLGETRLAAALASFPGEVVLRWRSFQLDPGAPRPGRPLMERLAGRFGEPERARQAMHQVQALAAAEGLRLDFDRAVIANSFDAHRLLWYADQPAAVVFGAGPFTQPDLAEALHRAHFSEGLDISSHEVLVEVAEFEGLDPDRVRQLLSTREGTPEVRGQIAKAHDLGITSVPTFVFAGKYSLTGARDTETLRAVLAGVAEEEFSGGALTVPRQRRVSLTPAPRTPADLPNAKPGDSSFGDPAGHDPSVRDQ